MPFTIGPSPGKKYALGEIDEVPIPPGKAWGASAWPTPPRVVVTDWTRENYFLTTLALDALALVANPALTPVTFTLILAPLSAALTR